MNNVTSPVYTDTLKRLLQGQVVCAWSAPECARILQDQQQRRRIDDWMIDLGCRLAETSGGAGFYLVHNRVDESARQDATKLFREIMGSLREQLLVISVLMEATNPDMALAPGDTLWPNKVVAAIEENPNLKEQLATLSSSRPQATIRQQVDTLVRSLRDAGIIVAARQEGEVYYYTARVELIQDMIVFIQENENLTLPGQDDHGQRDLL